MRILAVVSFTLILTLSPLVAGADLSHEQQIRIIEDYLYVTGQSGSMSQALADQQRESGYSCRMTKGIVVARIESRSEDSYRRYIGFFQVVGIIFQAVFL